MTLPVPSRSVIRAQNMWTSLNLVLAWTSGHTDRLCAHHRRASEQVSCHLALVWTTLCGMQPPAILFIAGGMDKSEPRWHSVLDHCSGNTEPSVNWENEKGKESCRDVETRSSWHAEKRSRNTNLRWRLYRMDAETLL